MRCLTALAILALAAAPATAQTVEYALTLSGAAAATPNDSPGTGSGLVTYLHDEAMLRVQADFTSLEGTVTAAHIHCCTLDALGGTADVATPTPTFPGFPSGVTEGVYDMTFDLTDAGSFNGGFIDANGGTPALATEALIAGFDSGRAYLNIHTSEFGGGEVRGFLQQVPEPASMVVAWMGLAGCAALRSRRG